MKILLLIGLCLIISVPALALECNNTETVFHNGESFSLKQSCDDNFDWIFTYIPTGINLDNIKDIGKGFFDSYDAPC